MDEFSMDQYFHFYTALLRNGQRIRCIQARGLEESNTLPVRFAKARPNTLLCLHLSFLGEDVYCKARDILCIYDWGPGNRWGDEDEDEDEQPPSGEEDYHVANG